MTGRKHAFPPVTGPQTRVLILGSLPGDASLAAQQYYAHPRNAFWRLIGAVIGRDDLAALPYAARLPVLLSSGVGLWDTVASATRAGSLDTAIRDADTAPLGSLVARLPELVAVAFNGQTSARLGRRDLAETALTLIDLPSSSPAHAAVPFAAKREKWLSLRQYLAAAP